MQDAIKTTIVPTLSLGTT